MKEIVIKIPDETLNVLMEHDWNDKKIVTEKALKTLEDAFFDGEVLPKGHGELKDAKQICQNIIAKLGIKDAGFLLPAEKEVFRVIEETEAVIEADKGE